PSTRIHTTFPRGCTRALARSLQIGRFIQANLNYGATTMKTPTTTSNDIATLDSTQLATVIGGADATAGFDWTGRRTSTGPTVPQPPLPEIWGAQTKRDAAAGAYDYLRR